MKMLSTLDDRARPRLAGSAILGLAFRHESWAPRPRGRLRSAGGAEVGRGGGGAWGDDDRAGQRLNLATYRGEQGFSGSLVGRVSPKVYINAGVGGSMVRGSTAGRVGISFGL
ncbi:hypothetical protein PX554_19475 [Sphingomonas sp. H39-1-10]|uniref:hypothetical protein n=1 Tax=Sphingomonas pollutisoli TaxID=3030829 RepID=UPI0023B88B8D|nr:hypothetical protein [Sphingomonas pollutisoli]MDF0490311.1 hypothetical protein [Sphingomonas pollutisoli]